MHTENTLPADPQPLSRREENKHQTREKILNSAASLFGRQGVANTTAEQIATGADISRATFFNYYTSKSVVVGELVARYDRLFRRFCEEELAVGVTTDERLRRLFARICALVESQPAFFRAIIGESFSQGSDAADSVVRLAEMHDGIAILLQAGVARDEVRQDYPLVLLAELISGALSSSLYNWRVTPDYPLAERLNGIASLFGETVAPLAGRLAGKKGSRSR